MLKKVLTLGLVCIILLGMSINALAAENDSQNKKTEIINYMRAINQQMGIVMTEQDIQNLENSVESSANMHAQQRDISIDSVYNLYLEELQREAPLSKMGVYSSGGDDIGDTQLPSSTTGDIFFVDNSMPYNHVGIYTSSTDIVESMPKDGVQYWPITNREAWQSPVTGSNNDSCILRPDTTSTNKSNAAKWAKHGDRLDTPYDYDFLDNKSDYYYLNLGTPEWPNWVQFEESDAYNCSELVWKAYKKNGNIDLDSNGGLAVYPNNIYNSSNVSIVKYWGD